MPNNAKDQKNEKPQDKKIQELNDEDLSKVAGGTKGQLPPGYVPPAGTGS